MEILLIIAFIFLIIGGTIISGYLLGWSLRLIFLSMTVTLTAMVFFLLFYHGVLKVNQFNSIFNLGWI